MKTESKMKNIFDRQRFENDEKLGKLISETENRLGRKLSDDELEKICAAGNGLRYRSQYTGGFVGIRSGGEIGNVTGNVTGNGTGNETGNETGSETGSGSECIGGIVGISDRKIM